MKIGERTEYPKLTVEVESVLIKRFHKIQSKRNKTNDGTNKNDNSFNSKLIFVSEENTNDRIIYQMENLGI